MEVIAPSLVSMEEARQAEGGILEHAEGATKKLAEVYICFRDAKTRFAADGKTGSAARAPAPRRSGGRPQPAHKKVAW